MTPDELARLKALADAATPGPWRVVPPCPHPIDESGDCGCFRGGDVVALPGEPAADADFTAAARTAVPALIAEVARLRAVLRQIAEGDLPHEQWCDTQSDCGHAKAAARAALPPEPEDEDERSVSRAAEVAALRRAVLARKVGP